MESSFGRSTRAFLLELRPGWWVLRGYLVVVTVALAGGRDRSFAPRPFPAISGSYMNGALLTVAAIVASVWYGRRVQRKGGRSRLAIAISIATMAAAGLAYASWEPPSYTSDYYEAASLEPNNLHHADGSVIANMCPYGSDGKLLNGVLLFDQDGRAIINLGDALPDGRSVVRRLPAILNAYPQSIQTFDEAGTPYDLTCPAAIGVQPKAVPSPVPNLPTSP